MKLPVSVQSAAPALRSLIPSIALAAALVGCGDKLDQNPVFKDQQNVVARLEDENKSIGRQVEDVNLTVAAIKQDVRELKNTPGGNSQVASDLAARLQEIQDALRDNTTRLAQLEIRMNNERAKAGATSVAATAAPKSVEPAKGAEKAGASAKPVKVVAQAGVKPGAKAEPGKTAEAGKPAAGTKITRTSGSAPSGKGQYYVVQDGDSAEQIAKKHNVTVSSLMSANGIPGGRSVKFAAGQRIFVPTATN